MAGRGGAPKDPETRARRNRDSMSPEQTVSVDGQLRGPELPNVLEDDSWHPRTLAWWDTWRRSPQAQTFLATDWEFLIDTALMHHTMWSKGRWEFAAELRLRAAKFGATPEDRLRLRLKVEAPGDAKSAEPEAQAAASRSRYGGLRVVQGELGKAAGQ